MKRFIRHVPVAHPPGQLSSVHNRSRRFCRWLLVLALLVVSSAWAQDPVYQLSLIHI